MSKHRVIVSLALFYEHKPNRELINSDAEIVRRIAERYTAATEVDLRTKSEPQYVSAGTPQPQDREYE